MSSDNETEINIGIEINEKKKSMEFIYWILNLLKKKLSLEKKKRKLENGNEIPKKKSKQQKLEKEDQNNTTEENEIETTGK